MSEVSIMRSERMRETAHDFCQTLLDPPDHIARLLHHVFLSEDSRITEHGPEQARKELPFLAHTFSGYDECARYFQMLSETLKMRMTPSTFPRDSKGFIVDPEWTTESAGDWEQPVQGKGAAVVVGQAEFESVKTGRSWREQFIYRLSGFNEDGSKFCHWEVWADPLSAWWAVKDEAILC